MTKTYIEGLIKHAKKLEEMYDEHPIEHQCHRCLSQISQLIGYIMALELKGEEQPIED